MMREGAEGVLVRYGTTQRHLIVRRARFTGKSGKKKGLGCRATVFYCWKYAVGMLFGSVRYRIISPLQKESGLRLKKMISLLVVSQTSKSPSLSPP